MSTRTPTAPAAGRTTTSATTNCVMVPHEKVAMRAYEKWRQRGCPCGSEKQDWYEAEEELRLEMSKPGAVGKK